MLFNYNFYYDSNSLSPVPNKIDTISKWTIQSGVFKKIHVETGLNDITTGDVPEQDWNDDTIVSCDFNNNINLGNLYHLLEQISYIRIQRRIKAETGQVDNDWVILAQVSITDVDDFEFIHRDYYAANGIQYEYGLAIIDTSGTEVIGTYLQETMSCFRQNLITDGVNVFYLNGSYALKSNRVQQTGIYDTIGGKMPIIIKNGVSDYDSLNITSFLSYNNNQTFDRITEIGLRNNLSSFLVNGRPKVYKDLNGNVWLIMVTDSPSFTFEQALGNGLSSVSFSAVQIGENNISADYISSGLTPVKPLYSYRGIKTGYPKVYNYPTGIQEDLVESVNVSNHSTSVNNQS